MYYKDGSYCWMPVPPYIFVDLKHINVKKWKSMVSIVKILTPIIKDHIPQRSTPSNINCCYSSPEPRTEGTVRCLQRQFQDMKLERAPILGRGFGGCLRVHSRYRIIPWWEPKGQSPLKLMNFRDFVGLNEVFNLDFCDISFREYT